MSHFAVSLTYFKMLSNPSAPVLRCLFLLGVVLLSLRSSTVLGQHHGGHGGKKKHHEVLIKPPLPIKKTVPILKCHADFSLVGEECQRKIVQPAVAACKAGMLVGDFDCVQSAPMTAKCPPGFQLEDDKKHGNSGHGWSHGGKKDEKHVNVQCIRVDVAPMVQSCQDGTLGSKGLCTRKVITVPRQVCPMSNKKHGFDKDDAGCFEYQMVEPILTCPIGTVLEHKSCVGKEKFPCHNKKGGHGAAVAAVVEHADVHDGHAGIHHDGGVEVSYPSSGALGTVSSDPSYSSGSTYSSSPNYSSGSSYSSSPDSTYSSSPDSTYSSSPDSTYSSDLTYSSSPNYSSDSTYSSGSSYSSSPNYSSSSSSSLRRRIVGGARRLGKHDRVVVAPGKHHAEPQFNSMCSKPIYRSPSLACPPDSLERMIGEKKHHGNGGKHGELGCYLAVPIPLQAICPDGGVVNEHGKCVHVITEETGFHCPAGFEPCGHKKSHGGSGSWKKHDEGRCCSVTFSDPIPMCPVGYNADGHGCSIHTEAYWGCPENLSLYDGNMCKGLEIKPPMKTFQVTMCEGKKCGDHVQSLI